MDRIEFSNLLKCSPLVINTHFDEIMGFYDIVSCYGALHINNININENNIIIFNVSVSQEYDIYYIKSLLDNIIFEKYLKIFRMDTTIDGDNKLNITLINL